MNLLNIQNIYVEILFKYLRNNSGYEQASKQFENLIKILLKQNTFLQTRLTHEKHHQIVENLLNKMDSDEIMDSSC